MSCHAIELQLQPAANVNRGCEIKTYVYKPDGDFPSSMSESVYLSQELGSFRVWAELTPDEARVLANQLLQVADTADEQRAARLADDEQQASFDAICDELRDADERGGGAGCYYAHPDVHYVPADQVDSKVRELNAAGVKRFLVLAEPEEQAA